MNERNKRIAATVTSVLAAASITTGFALGSGSSSSTPTLPAAATPAAATPAAPAVDPAGDPNAQGPDTGTQAAEPAGDKPDAAEFAGNTAEPVGTDTDNVQQGDQNGPDTQGAAGNEQAKGPDTDNVQQGDQNGPDTAGAADTNAK